MSDILSEEEIAQMHPDSITLIELKTFSPEVTGRIIHEFTNFGNWMSILSSVITPGKMYYYVRGVNRQESEELQLN